MKNVSAKVIQNSRVKENYFRCVISDVDIAGKAQPGQFVEIRVSDTLDPFLRRPLGIHRVDGGKLSVLYEVVGKGTQALSRRKPGESLDIIGPLGKGFQLPENNRTIEQQSVLVAGGMGVAPLVFLAEKLVTRSQGHKVTRKPLVLIGARSKKQILCEKEFKELGCEVKVATDDGSVGFKGRVTDLLKKILLVTCDLPACRQGRQPVTLFSCGPKPMLKEISRISKQHNIPAQISLEEHMACGIGACLGCVVDTTMGSQRVCKDGPVFNAQEVVW